MGRLRVVAFFLFLIWGLTDASRVRIRDGVAVVSSPSSLHGALSRVMAKPDYETIVVDENILVPNEGFQPLVRLVDRTVEIRGASREVTMRIASRKTNMLELSTGTELNIRNISIVQEYTEFRNIEELLKAWLDIKVSAKVTYESVKVFVSPIAFFRLRQEWQSRLQTVAVSDTFLVTDVVMEQLEVRDVSIIQLSAGEELVAHSVFEVASAPELVFALRAAEKSGQNPIHIYLAKSVEILPEDLQGAGVINVRRDVVVEGVGDEAPELRIGPSLSPGKFVQVASKVQLTLKNIVEVYGDKVQEFCGQVCLPTFHSAIGYGPTGFTCGLSHVDMVLSVTCPYIASLRAAVSDELRKSTSDGLPPPLMQVRHTDGGSMLHFSQFVGYGVCFSNVTISCDHLDPPVEADIQKQEKKAIIILCTVAAAGILVCIIAIVFVPKYLFRALVNQESKKNSSSLESTSTSLGGLNTKGDSVKTYLMGQINGERLGISDDAVEITEQIASGGYGVVYKGTWKSLPVAIKTVIFQDVADGAGKEKQRAIFEAAISSSIAHRNVVQTYTYSFKQLQTSNALNSIPIRGDDFSRVCVDWKLYIVQELCEGGSLRNALKDRVLRSCSTHDKFVRGVLQLALDIAEGLFHLHNHNIVHGDVNTKNVLLREDHATSPLNLVAKIADFGLSVKMNYMQSHISNHKAGTPFYMAPEVVQHGVLSKRADIFSYGVVLWEIYHQSCPIQTTGGNGNLQYHEKFPKFPVSCPMLYALLCVVCLSPSPDDRPDFEFVIKVLKAINSSVDNDKEFLPSKIQKQNLDLVKKLNGKTGRELVEFVGELLGEDPGAGGSGSATVASHELPLDSADNMAGESPESARCQDPGHPTRRLNTVSSTTEPTYSMTITLGSKDGHTYSSDSISFSWDRASSPEPKSLNWSSKKSLRGHKLKNFPEVPSIGANPLLDVVEENKVEKPAATELPEAKPNDTGVQENPRPPPMFPLRFTAPSGGSLSFKLSDRHFSTVDKRGQFHTDDLGRFGSF